MRPDHRRVIWNHRLRELARERSVIIQRKLLGTPEPGDKTLLRHLDRELNYYEMQLLRPAYARLEAAAKARRRAARRFVRAVEDLRKDAEAARVESPE
jgi:hypothetical protein